MELILSLLTGGATGLIGTVFGGIFKWLERRQNKQEKEAEYAHVEKMHALQMEASRQESAAQLALAEVRAAGEQKLASYAHDTGYGRTYRWVIAILRLVRPALTVFLLLLTWWIYDSLVTGQSVVDGIAIADGIPDAERAGMINHIVASVVYAATVAVTWWFGDKAITSKRQ